MIFPSYIFLFVFLPAVLAVWYTPLSPRARLIWLIIASYIFYGWWDYRFVSLLLFSTVLDYSCGKQIILTQDPRAKKFWLALAMVCNLSLLGFFKYFDFFSRSIAAVLAACGIIVEPVLLDIILPLGISFYTFNTMSYTLDLYFGKAPPVKDLVTFAAYVALFPHLVAGPIIRYRELAHQLELFRSKGTTLPEIANGVWLFVLGLAKKLIIADEMAFLVNRLFDGQHAVQAGHAWAGTLAYSVQIYFDFSGYSDMAIGLALMLGFRFPINFLSPYKSRNISEFWNRWHITLSHFLRDYLFIPLGGSRHGTAKTARNMVLTMFLGGLWHGAQWTFVAWGLLHGLYLALHAIFKALSGTRGKAGGRATHILCVAVTFLSVHFAWVLFRSPNFERAIEIYRGLLGLNGCEDLWARNVESLTFGKLPNAIDIFGGPEHLPFLLFGLGIAFFAKNTYELRRTFSFKQAAVLSILFLYCVGAMGKETPFLYFQF